MRQKGYLAGAATLAAVLLSGCTSGSGDETGSTDGKGGGFAPSPSRTAEPGKYRSLPDPCDAVGRDALDSMLPGLEALQERRREKLYAGSAAVTFDTDRRAGCSWTVDSPDATHRLHVDFERVVSYDNAVSDDALAESLFLDRRIAADLPEPTSTDEETDEETGGETDGETGGGGDEKDGADDGEESRKPSGGTSDAASRSASRSAPDRASDTASDTASGSADPEHGTPSTSPSTTPPPEGLEPRILEGLADEAFLDDELSAADSAARRRVVTVVFRTSNVLVTVEYEARPASVQEVPDSKELQDRAQVLAGRLAERFTD
ncbi:DUF3558 domain-containing protein [Streptomyces sp. KLOTTS4A1]|uniref:DUF3558 domain-containing protein n=1 Tax=Streptomyces sp. KLOTTS4A1 TaxID=3390996 RepID=UPI0039F599BA